MKSLLSVSVFSLLSASAAAIEPCDSIYERGSPLGEGYSKLVYEAGSKKVDGTCWAADCAPTVVKELRSNPKTNVEQATITKKAIEWNIAPPVYLRGECVRHNKTLSFEIERLFQPLTRELLSKRPDYFAGKIQRRLDRLHIENIIHGDPHIGNILIDASDQVFLSDFDTSFLVKNPKEWKGRVAFENFLASQIWSRTSTWQFFAHKFKQFDLNRDGKISESELDNLSDSVGSWEQAVVISKIYFEQVSRLSTVQKPGFFLDTYNNGVANREEMQTWG